MNLKQELKSLKVRGFELKQYTTPKLIWTLEGFGDVIANSDNYAIYIYNSATKASVAITKDNNRIEINGDTFSVRLNPDETRDLVGENKFEMYWQVHEDDNEYIYSTDTSTFVIERTLTNPSKLW